jgi:hypothetical protein
MMNQACGTQCLCEARSKRAEKEAAKKVKGKGKRGRKPKNAVPETEVEAVVLTANKERGRKRKKLVQEAEVTEAAAKRVRASEAPEQSIAPVAKII